MLHTENESFYSTTRSSYTLCYPKMCNRKQCQCGCDLLKSMIPYSLTFSSWFTVMIARADLKIILNDCVWVNIYWWHLYNSLGFLLLEASNFCNYLIYTACLWLCINSKFKPWGLTFRFVPNVFHCWSLAVIHSLTYLHPCCHARGDWEGEILKLLGINGLCK